MLFDLQAFIAAPSQELLNLAKKSDLLDIAAHYEVPSVNKSMLKQEIKNIPSFLGIEPGSSRIKTQCSNH